MTTEAELNAMTRAELDDLATQNGLNPNDYPNKEAEVAALVPLVGSDPTPDPDAPSSSEEASSDLSTTPGGLDPMLVDPDAQQRAAFEGTSNDPATHVEGVAIEDVKLAPAQGDFPSDAEDYPFPQGGDVDDALRERVEAEGEVFVPPNIEDWVVLDGESEAVPDLLGGRRAVIINVDPEPVPWAEKDDVELTVRTRDDTNATLYITMADVLEVQKRGVSPVR